MIVVIYIPSDEDPLSGPIDHQFKGRLLQPHDIFDCWVEVFEDRPDWDVTHEVRKGKVVKILAATRKAREMEVAKKRLRARRGDLMRDHVDGISPVRWAVMTDEEKAEISAYRQALLDWPKKEKDFLNPTEPTPPAFLRK